MGSIVSVFKITGFMQSRSWLLLMTASLIVAGLATPIARATFVEMSKTHDPHQPIYHPGDNFKFLISLSVYDEQGGSALSIKDMSITDNLPDGLTYVAGSQVCSPACSFTDFLNGTLKWDFGAGPFTTTPQATVSFNVTVDMDASTVNPLVNLAYAHYTETVSGVVSDPAVTEFVEVVYPILDVDKTCTPLIHEGDDILYTITLTNTGSEDADGIVVTDTLPPHVTYSGGATATSGTLDFSTPGIVTWSGDIGNVTGTNTVTISIPVTDDPAFVSTTLTNVVAYMTYPPWAAFVNIEDTCVTQVIHPAIEVIKTCNVNIPIAPGQVTYSYVARNIGDTPLTNVHIWDETLGIHLAGPVSLAVGTQIGPFTHVRPGLAEGTYVNVANATGVDQLGLIVSDHDDATCVIGETPSVGGEVLRAIPDASGLAGTMLVALAAVAAVYLRRR